LRIRTKNGYILQILRGGLVANFTGKPDSSPGNIIQMTRGLLFAAVIQIIEEFKVLVNSSGPIMLDPNLQMAIIDSWFSDQSSRMRNYWDEVTDGFRNKEWIEINSKGTIC
jgi:hypothetical protein